MEISKKNHNIKASKTYLKTTNKMTQNIDNQQISDLTFYKKTLIELQERYYKLNISNLQEKIKNKSYDNKKMYRCILSDIKYYKEHSDILDIIINSSNEEIVKFNYDPNNLDEFLLYGMLAAEKCACKYQKYTTEEKNKPLSPIGIKYVSEDLYEDGYLYLYNFIGNYNDLDNLCHEMEQHILHDYDDECKGIRQLYKKNKKDMEPKLLLADNKQEDNYIKIKEFDFDIYRYYRKNNIDQKQIINVNIYNTYPIPSKFLL